MSNIDPNVNNPHIVPPNAAEAAPSDATLNKAPPSKTPPPLAASVASDAELTSDQINTLQTPSTPSTPPADVLADEPAPPTPQANPSASNLDQLTQAMQNVLAVLSMLEKLEKTEREVAAKNAPPPPDTVPPKVNPFLRGSSITAVKVAFMELAALLSYITAQEQKFAKEYRQAAREDMYDAMDAIKQSGQLKSDMLNQEASFALQKALASGITQIGGAVLSVGLSRRMSPETVTTFTRGIADLSSGILDAQEKWMKAGYEIPIAEQDAQKTFFEQEGQTMSSARESANDMIRKSRELLQSMLDQLTQIQSKEYQINIGRNA